MRAVKGKGTNLERRLFAMLAGMRLHGWRKNVSALPGKPDAVFFQERVIIFVDGCFWHGCPICKRPLPVTNRDYWEKKIQRNVERDRRNTESLTQEGWRVIRVWEHIIRNSSEKSSIRQAIREALEDEEAPG